MKELHKELKLAAEQIGEAIYDWCKFDELKIDGNVIRLYKKGRPIAMFNTETLKELIKPALTEKYKS
jgi:hypothetical protein